MASRNVLGPMRILIYSHDTFGLGHYRRCLKIAKQIAAEHSESSVLILTGSPLVNRYSLPDGIDTVKLPAVVKVGREAYRSRSSRLSLDSSLHLRAEIMCTTAAAFVPDVVLIDHAPLGLQGEARKSLEYCRFLPQRPRLILGMRDIIDHPDQVVSLWRRTGIYDAIDSLYDMILIYGARDMYDSVAEYSFPETLARKTTFVGYIGDRPANDDANAKRTNSMKTVVVTVGGGEDGQQIVEAFLSLLETIESDIDFKTILLPGPLLSDSTVADLRARASRFPVQVEHFTHDISGLLKEAEVVVAMGGYNTVAEILTYARRAIIIPRETPRREQLLRAQLLHARGIIDMVRLGELTAARLGEAVKKALNTSIERVTQARGSGTVPLDGAHRIVELLNQSVSLPEEAGAV